MCISIVVAHVNIPSISEKNTTNVDNILHEKYKQDLNEFISDGTMYQIGNNPDMIIHDKYKPMLNYINELD